MNKKLKNVLLPIIAVAAVTVTSSLSFGMINDNQYNNQQIFRSYTIESLRPYTIQDLRHIMNDALNNLNTKEDKIVTLDKLIRILAYKISCKRTQWVREKNALNNTWTIMELVTASGYDNRQVIEQITKCLDESEKKFKSEIKETIDLYNKAITEITNLDPSLM